MPVTARSSLWQEGIGVGRNTLGPTDNLSHHLSSPPLRQNLEGLLAKQSIHKTTLDVF